MGASMFFGLFGWCLITTGIFTKSAHGKENSQFRKHGQMIEGRVIAIEEERTEDGETWTKYHLSTFSAALT